MVFAVINANQLSSVLKKKRAAFHGTDQDTTNWKGRQSVEINNTWTQLGLGVFYESEGFTMKGCIFQTQAVLIAWNFLKKPIPTI